MTYLHVKCLEQGLSPHKLSRNVRYFYIIAPNTVSHGFKLRAVLIAAGVSSCGCSGPFWKGPGPAALCSSL